ncbi:hypothetical protein SteCoe_27265 [Stentor coeruleus]|uniref:Uncharacterized protein n=1 Tax=Stentor coeruleus TaxID=5963 RepID=A0A1R2BB12_9CILI|nr:hypothetical protein SteCoe_27265 [Stentor coeruleus]
MRLVKRMHYIKVVEKCQTLSLSGELVESSSILEQFFVHLPTFSNDAVNTNFQGQSPNSPIVVDSSSESEEEPRESPETSFQTQNSRNNTAENPLEILSDSENESEIEEITFANSKMPNGQLKKNEKKNLGRRERSRESSETRKKSINDGLFENYKMKKPLSKFRNNEI